MCVRFRKYLGISFGVTGHDLQIQIWQGCFTRPAASLGRVSTQNYYNYSLWLGLGARDPTQQLLKQGLDSVGKKVRRQKLKSSQEWWRGHWESETSQVIANKSLSLLCALQQGFNSFKILRDIPSQTMETAAIAILFIWGLVPHVAGALSNP